MAEVDKLPESSLLLNIGDMIDLAIGTPEVGVVDFNMLQSVLHVLAQQMRIQGKNVELRGSMAQLPLTRDNVQTVAVTELIVDTDVKPQTGDQGTMLVVKRVKKTDSHINIIPEGGVADKTVGGAHAAGAGRGGAAGGMGVAGGVAGERVSLVTVSKFNMLEVTVNDLKSRVYGSIPKNEDILQEVRSQTNLKSITDMWTSLNVSSRLEAAEAGLSKLSSLIQDLIGGSTGVTIGAPIARSERGSQTDIGSVKSERPPATATDLSGVNQILQHLRTDLDELTANFYAALEEQGIDIPPPRMAVLYATATGGPATCTIPAETGQSPSSQSSRAASPAPTDTDAPPAVRTQGTGAGGRQQRRSFSSGLSTRVDDLERQIKECCDQRSKQEDVVHDQLTSFQDQLEYLSKQLACVSGDEADKISPTLVKDVEGLMQLFQTVQEMQEQLIQVHDTALKLAAEKEERTNHMNALIEQIELLKTIKLDREDMFVVMAEKADVRHLARKVSQDQFESACDDLSKGLERALGKLTIQEALWQQALDDIQREIEMKLDKLELSPVKEFFTNKLRQLQEYLRQMADLRRETEAAGTKKRILRDVNCISCDARAVMAMDTGPSLPTSKPMPATLSMKPYLTYELDAIRKQQATTVPQRNMHDWENIDKQMQQPKSAKVRSETDKHLCNRYCGGSHTVTTPAQRVVRLGHFIKQWGPDVVPLSTGMAAGDDGKMYKICTTENVNVGPGGAVDNYPSTPKSSKKSDACTRAPPVVKPECRCLEAAILALLRNGDSLHPTLSPETCFKLR